MGRMNIAQSIRLKLSLIIPSLLMAACSANKLEARLQADPQCKPMMNQKTGALMPCPGSDKEFYKSIPALSAVVSEPTQGLATITAPSSLVTNPKATVVPVECKPQLHQKSGSLMPCPAP
jgi:hypothetical protein